MVLGVDVSIPNYACTYTYITPSLIYYYLYIYIYICTPASFVDIKYAVDSPRVRKRYEHDAHTQETRNNSNNNHCNSNSSSSVGGSMGGSDSTDLNDNGTGTGVAMELIGKQDVQLGHLGHAVSQLGTMAGSINEELRQQNDMLTEMDHDLEAAGDRMSNVMMQLSKLMKTKDRCQLYSILMLICILGILGKLLDVQYR